MSVPITWRNVTGPALPDASAALARATATIDGAFSKWGSTIDDYQTQQKTIFDEAELGQVMDFRERLAAAKTPEEVAALQGQLNAMRGSLTAASREKVLGAEEARTSALQKQFVDGLNYKHTVTDEQQHPLVQELRMRIAAEPTKAAQIMAEPQYAVLRNIGVLAGEARTAETAAEKLGFDRNRDTRDKARQDRDFKHMDVTERISEKNADTQAQSVKLQAELNALQKADILDKGATAAASAAVAASDTLAGSNGATKTLHESLKAAGVTGSRLEYLVEYGNKELSNPLNKNVPVSQIVNGLLGTDKWNVPGFNWLKGGPGADLAGKITEWRNSKPGELEISNAVDNKQNLAARAASARQLADQGFTLAGLPQLVAPPAVAKPADTPATSPASADKTAPVALKTQQDKDVKALDAALSKAQANAPSEAPKTLDAAQKAVKEAETKVRSFGVKDRENNAADYAIAVRLRDIARANLADTEKAEAAVDLARRETDLAKYLSNPNTPAFPQIRLRPN